MSWSQDSFLIDISKVKGKKLVLVSAIETLRREGLFSLFQKFARTLFFKIKGVDFSPQNLHDLQIESKFKQNASVCNHILDKSFDEILKKLKSYDPLITDGVFVDYGSGKGKTLYKASKFGFREVIGVEFAKELYEISERNLKKLGIKNAKTIHLDATLFTPPKDARVLFFHNPFDERVFEKVLDNIERSEFEKDLYIVYHYPLCKEVFEKRERFLPLEEFISPTSGERSYFYLLGVK